MDAEKAMTGKRALDLKGVAETFVWTPKRLRWDPNATNELSWGLTFLYALTTGVTVANLYYSYPILKLLAEDFGVTNERASLVPTILQCGYACGLLFIIPIGDIGRRRPLVLGLMLITSLLWLGLILTKSFNTFIGLSFLAAVTTCTPQLMFPLTVQYAPLRHRATMTSIMMSGLVLGITVARLIGGVVSQFVPWRITYWISFGLQLVFLLLLLLFMPDYPISRPGTSYLGSLWTIVRLPFQHPILTQQSLIAFLTMGTFTCFWTTLTFQLTDQFGYNTLKIGLFSLIAFGPVLLNPVVSSFVTARFHPIVTLVIAHIIGLAATCIGTFVGNFSIGGLVVRAFLGDLGMNTAVVANRMAIANVHPTAQNAVNSVYMVFTFCGQMSGTAAGNKLYAQGGWISAGTLMICYIGASFLLVFARGPHEKGWIGWHGGWDLSMKKAEKPVVVEKGGETGLGELSESGLGWESKTASQAPTLVEAGWGSKTGSKAPTLAERRDGNDDVLEKV